MKVALINLPFSIDSDKSTSQEIHFFPEGLSLIAASLLKAQHIVTVTDLSQQSEKELYKLSSVDVFGISTMVNQFQSLKKIIYKLRKINPKAKIILGGPLISSDPLLISKFLDFDFGVIGEGEITITDLLKNLGNPEKVNGIAIQKDGGGILLTPPRNLSSLKNIPTPAFELFNLPWYLKGEKRSHLKSIKTQQPTLNNFMISRGCPFNCQFCYRLFGKKISYKSIPKIRAELKTWHEAGVKFIRFQDDNFTVMPNNQLKQVLQVIKEFNFKWACQSRVDTIDQEKLEQMKKAGLEIIYYGIESLSDKVLDKIGKSTNVKKIKKAIELTLKAGITPAAFLIIGLPGETEQSLKKMLDFVKHYKIPVTPYLLCPLPGTELFNYAKRKGKIKNEEKFLTQCQNWEEEQLDKNKIHINLTELPDQLLLNTYRKLLKLIPKVGVIKYY